MERLKWIMKKYWDIVSYLVFGVLTTAVNYLVYLPLLNIVRLPAAVCNIIAWVVAVAFAYLTNKPFVFKSHDWSKEVVIPELSKFVSCRIASGVMETVLIFFAVDFQGWDGNIWKLITSVLVVVLNYLFSKLIVFKNKS